MPESVTQLKPVSIVDIYTLGTKKTLENALKKNYFLWIVSIVSCCPPKDMKETPQTNIFLLQ